jgi:type IV pilus assembly protein PilB
MELGANRLGEMLLEAGLIDRFQLESALSLQRNLGGRIGSALVKLGYLPEETILEFIESQAKFARVDLDELEIPAELMKLLSVERMLDLLVVPIELRKNKGEKNLRMAMTDPTNSRLIDDLQFATGCKILPVVATEDEIREAINNNLPAAPPSRQEQLLSEEVDHQLIDFSQTPGEDPRVDRLLEVLQQKGILSVIDVERIKFD